MVVGGGASVNHRQENFQPSLNRTRYEESVVEVLYKCPRATEEELSIMQRPSLSRLNLRLPCAIWVLKGEAGSADQDSECRRWEEKQRKKGVWGKNNILMHVVDHCVNQRSCPIYPRMGAKSGVK